MDGVVAAATGDEVAVVAPIDFVVAVVSIDIVRNGRGAAVDEVGLSGSFYQFRVASYFDSIECTSNTLGTAVERDDSHKGR
jgi:hypothetical protein